MRSISVFFDKIYIAGSWLSGALLILLCGLILYSIVARLFGLYAGGTTDVAGYVMGACTFMALARTFRENVHIRILLFIQKTYGPLRVLLERWALAVMSLVTGYVAYYFIRLTLDSFEYGERSQGADAILLWIPQVPMALGACLFALAVFHTFFEVIVCPEKIDPDDLNELEQAEA